MVDGPTLPGQSDPAPDIDITTVKAGALSIAVPLNTKVTGDYLRLGHANAVDEGTLPLAPSEPESDLVGSRYSLPGAADATPGGPDSAPDGSTAVRGTTSTDKSLFTDGILAYSTEGLQLVGPFGYFRIGDDSQYESTLRGANTEVAGGYDESAGDDSSRIGKGILLFSEKNVHTIAPTTQVSSDAFTLYSTDSLSVTGGKSAMVSASRSMGSSEWASTVSFNRNSTFTAQLGSIIQAVTGNQVSQYLGNMSTCGVGTTLSGNYGFTQNANGGQSVQIMNKTVQVTGWQAGQSADEYSQAAVTRLSLSCSPLVAAGGLSAKVVATTVAIFATLGAALGAGAVDTALSVRMTEGWHGASTDFSSIREKIDELHRELYSIEGMQTCSQILVLAVGLFAKWLLAASVGSPLGSLTIVDGIGLKLESGAGMLVVSAAGIQMEGVTINAAAPAITMTGQVSFL